MSGIIKCEEWRERERVEVEGGTWRRFMIRCVCVMFPRGRFAPIWIKLASISYRVSNNGWRFWRHPRIKIMSRFQMGRWNVRTVEFVEKAKCSYGLINRATRLIRNWTRKDRRRRKQYFKWNCTDNKDRVIERKAFNLHLFISCIFHRIFSNSLLQNNFLSLSEINELHPVSKFARQLNTNLSTVEYQKEEWKFANKNRNLI